VGGTISIFVDGFEQLVGSFDADLLPLRLGTEAKYQNTAEFIGLVVGIRVAQQAGLDVSRVRVRGDSMSMLTWAENGHFRGSSISAAACIFTFMTEVYAIEWLEGIDFHVAGVDHKRSDMLSRKAPWEAIVTEFPELSHLPFWRADAGTRELILLCDPRQVCESDEVFARRWHRILCLLRM
jgi:hypothetical protein